MTAHAEGRSSPPILTGRSSLEMLRTYRCVSSIMVVSLPFFHVFVCMMCMCVSMLVWVWVLMCTYKVVRSFPLMLIYLIPWSRVSQSNPELTSMSTFTSQLALGIHSPSETKILGKLLSFLGIRVGSRTPDSGPLAWVASTLIASHLRSPVLDISESSQADIQSQLSQHYCEIHRIIKPAV